MRRAAFLTALAVLTFGSLLSSAAPAITTVEIASARLRVGDFVKDAAPNEAAIDLGPAPATSGSRLLSRGEIERLLKDAGYAKKVRLPEAMRVVRKMKKLDADAFEAEVRKAAALPRGVSLAAVRAPRATDVPDGFDRVTLDVGKVSRRAGSQPVTARVAFLRGEELLATVTLPVELLVSAEAARPDAPRGTPITLVVRHGLVEVTTSGVAGADADVGAVLPVTVRATGHVVKAKLVEPARAVLVEAP